MPDSGISTFWIFFFLHLRYIKLYRKTISFARPPNVTACRERRHHRSQLVLRASDSRVRDVRGQRTLSTLTSVSNIKTQNAVSPLITVHVPEPFSPN